MPGTTLEGHGVSTYNPATKKYVGSWTDSMSGFRPRAWGENRSRERRASTH